MYESNKFYTLHTIELEGLLKDKNKLYYTAL